MKQRVSDPSEHMMKTGTDAKQQHAGFQFNSNPMAMTDFEKSCAAKEVAERKTVTRKQVLGMQGTDGGSFIK